MKTINVLISAAGSPLGQSIYKALLSSKLPLRFFLSDIRPLAAGFYLNKASTNIILPVIRHPEYTGALTESISKYHINCIFPVLDTEHEFFAKSGSHWKKLGVAIVTNKADAHTRAANKYSALSYLRSCGIAVPDTISADDAKARRIFFRQHTFPVIFKPKIGVSSEKLFIVRSDRQLKGLLNAFDASEFIIQEYLGNASEEYTIGVYISRDRSFQKAFVIQRELKFGLSYTGTVVKNTTIEKYSLAVSKTLDLQFASNVQLRTVNGIPYVFEINPRLSSTTSVRAFFGYNEPEMILTELFRDIHAYAQKIRLGSFMRYWEEIYLPK